MDMDEYVIETPGLTRQYDGFPAIDSLDLRVRPGEFYGPLGPNGSGKTTTILMLLGLTEPSAGVARILGFDPVRQPLAVKLKVGYMPDQVGFYGRLTARENLTYSGKLIGLPRAEYQRRIERSLERMGLGAVSDEQVETFSHGMRQRLGVADLLLKRPQIVVMDEPTSALGPEAARRLLGIIRQLRSDGITILLASHLLPQVQQVCDRVGLFYHGHLALEGTVQQLAQQVLGTGYRLTLSAAGDRAVIRGALKGIEGVVDVLEEEDGTYHLLADSDYRASAARAVVEVGGELTSLSVDEPSLDDVYAEYFEAQEEVEHVRAA
jgi:ABC-2 type transport system ATP-binding protein